MNTKELEYRERWLSHIRLLYNLYSNFEYGIYFNDIKPLIKRLEEIIKSAKVVNLK